MPLYKLEELEHTHGTIQLIDDSGGTLQKKDGFVLCPQPRLNDPNDPLNWSTKKKIAALYSILLLSMLCNFCITGLGTGFSQLEGDFGVGINKLSYLISATGLGQAMGCFLCAPLASKFGKRPVWLACSVIFFVCNIWAAVAKNFASLLCARIFATWAAGTSEPLSFATINDLFFLHERGTQAGVQGMWLTFGSSMAPVICGYLIQAAGWRWYYWLVTILAGIDVVLIFLFFPETGYRRNLHTSMDITHAIDDASFQSDEAEQEKIETLRTVFTGNSTSAYPKKMTLMQELKPWSPVDPDVNIVGAFIRPWAVWAFPSMIWGVSGILTECCVASQSQFATVWRYRIDRFFHGISVVVLLSLQPISLAEIYHFKAGAQGLASLGAFVGVNLGALFCGHLNDLLSHRLAKRNQGVFEPEMRIPVIIFPTIIVPLGLILFGVGIKNEWHWIVPIIGAGMVNFGLPALPAIMSPYIMDSYYPLAMDCLILFNGFKNFVSFGVGFAVIPWIDRSGIVAVFCILAAMMFAVYASFAFLYIFGKSLRKGDAQKKIFLF